MVFKKCYVVGRMGFQEIVLQSWVSSLHVCKCCVCVCVCVCAQVACGYAHVLGLTEAGQIYSWGSNFHGQLGTSNKTNHLVPTLVAGEMHRYIRWLATELEGFVCLLVCLLVLC